jgi:hypothetical protein
MASSKDEIRQPASLGKPDQAQPKTTGNWKYTADSLADKPAVSPVPGPSAPARHTTAMTVKTYTRILKLGISAIIVFASCYFTVKSAYPFLMELARPGTPGGPISKDAPTSVKILQQTRGVIAKNDANVARLNALIDDPLGAGPAPSETRLAIAPLPPQPKPPEPKPAPKFEVRLEPLSGLVLDELHVSGVIGGRRPKITINGMLVSVGGVVDNKRRLRFLGLDEARRLVVFGNGVETISKSY